jgi:hypothetical protein
MPMMLLRRAGNGWIAATYEGRRCVDLMGGPWEDVRGAVLGTLGAPSDAPPALTVGERPDTSPGLRSGPRSSEELLDASEPKDRARV